MWVLVVLMAMLGLEPPATAGTDDTLVRISTGALRGVAAGDVVRFLGVPYAAPPLGDRRWRPPGSVPTWDGVRPATESGPPCAQGNTGPSNASEDCLHVDVTVPHGGRSGKPVLVWLHGGGLTTGAGSEYDPERMAAQGDVIVVTVDFRLGIFGFYGHSALPGSGTFGLLDQQAALRWVQRDIGAFGGDPGRVTLAGQSGGAVATCAQLTSPLSAGLFQRAVLQSGSCGMNWPQDGLALGTPAGSFFAPVSRIARNGDAAAQALGCRRDTDAEELACLRALPAHALDGQHGSFGIAATGTETLPLAPEVALRAGLFHRVPVLSGNTHDEQRLIAGIYAALHQPITAARYPALIAGSFGTDAPAVLARYPLPAYGGDGALAWSAVFTDRIWACQQTRTAHELARFVPVYSYEFADEHAHPVATLPADFPAGAAHTSELPSLFDVAGRPPVTGPPSTDDQRRLASDMLDFWTTFARTGHPALRWPRHGTQRLAPGPGGIGPVDTDAEHQCAFWTQLAR
jgi:para-nitrobenzyl esterase